MWTFIAGVLSPRRYESGRAERRFASPPACVMSPLWGLMGLIIPITAFENYSLPMPLHSLKRQQANTASTTTIRAAKTDGG